jgi:hypothetical protein
MSATRHLMLVLGAAALVASAAPVYADQLIAAPRAGAANDRAYGSGATAFHSREAPLPRASMPIDPRLVLAVVLAVPAGTSADTNSGNSNAKAPGKDGGSSSNSNSNSNSNDGDGDGGGDGGGSTSTSGSPEPATLVTALIGAGVAGCAALRRRRTHAASPQTPQPV